MSAVNRELANAIIDARDQIADGLVETTRLVPRFREQMEQSPDGLEHRAINWQHIFAL